VSKGDFGAAKMHFDEGEERAACVSYVLPEARKLEQLPCNSSKASAMPSADSISEARLFQGVFDTAFKCPDTLMLEISTLLRVALRHIQISIPARQSPAVTSCVFGAGCVQTPRYRLQGVCFFGGGGLYTARA
jgi:hypothetical protein